MYETKSPAVLKELAKEGKIINGITGEMTFFPLCCSTGVLKNLTARAFTAYDVPCCTIKDKDKDAVIADIQQAKNIRDLIRNTRPYGRWVMPVEWARDYALSLIHIKCTEGKDDGESGGYNNFKAAQVVWFDRLNADKRSGRRFNNYNTTYACDTLTEWLGTRNPKFWGEILISKPQDGAHGARVRGCVYTPNVRFLGRFLDKRLAVMKTEMLDQLKHTGEAAWQIK